MSRAEQRTRSYGSNSSGEAEDHTPLLPNEKAGRLPSREASVGNNMNALGEDLVRSAASSDHWARTAVQEFRTRRETITAAPSTEDAIHDAVETPLVQNVFAPPQRKSVLRRSSEVDPKVVLRRMGLLGVMLLLVTLGATDRISFKYVADAAPLYMFFMHQLTVLAFTGVFFARMAFNKRSPLVPRRLVRKFATLGAIDALSTLSMFVAAPHVYGPSQVLLLQGVIPLSVGVSMLVFKRRFHFAHYIGSFIIVGGIIPSLFAHHAEDKGATTTSLSLWILLFFGSSLPAAISGAYREYIVADDPADVDMHVMNGWASCFQLLTGFILSPLVAEASGVSASATLSNFADSARCVFGMDGPAPFCQGFATRAIFLYIIVNIIMNMVIFYLVSHAPNKALFACLIAIIPAANLGFCITYTPLIQPAKLDWQDELSLVLTILGVLVYRSKDEPRASQEEAPVATRVRSETVDARVSFLSVQEGRRSGGDLDELEPNMATSYTSTPYWGNTPVGSINSPPRVPVNYRAARAQTLNEQHNVDINALPLAPGPGLSSSLGGSSRLADASQQNFNDFFTR